LIGHSLIVALVVIGLSAREGDSRPEVWIVKLCLCVIHISLSVDV
jgi:hypothetical protein